MSTDPSTTSAPDFRAEARGLADHLRDLRRDLHRDPETGLELPHTQARVLAELEGLGLEIHTGRELSSVVAVLRGGAAGSADSAAGTGAEGAPAAGTRAPSVLLRGDMDALPVAEATGLDYASTNGAMHACGHDLHISGLVGAAKLLAAHRAQLPGDVIFMFQPGEEADRGAKVMLDEGMWDAVGGKPDAAFGIHVWSGEPGLFLTRPGTMMAGANRLFVTFRGKAGHASRPQDSLNPVLPLIDFCHAFQGMVTSGFSVFDPVVATITQLDGSTAVNAIPGEASMGASVRTLSAETTAKFPVLARRLAESVAASHGAEAVVDWIEQYPPTVNDDAEAAFALDALRGMFGAERVVESPDPVMGSEDFSYVLEEVPGAFLFFQVSPEHIDPAQAATNHSPLVEFDDALLPDQAAALAGLAWARLAR
ncbi:M20 family metallopeptidase [Brevibacterium sp. 50QC2O2]|uniref:M20 metallopeptidase family protein n=1 Tax=Brevibacterium sp. 50QC2O2 TaxID=2968459 RepID=UPI00211C5667|nr:M20 family metallopeptidase [Brevibacterium sp. 50QC2O2]MCQ9389888.1 M20 family metallopeptidase [Brevibacterium sp. 50QC2O2]